MKNNTEISDLHPVTNPQIETELIPVEDVKKDEDEPMLTAFSPTAQKIILSKENMGHFDAPDLCGKFRGCCGDGLQIELILDGELIKDARYTTDGCLATIAVAGMLTKMIKGKPLDMAQVIKSSALIEALGGLPRGHLHCANLAVKVLRLTIGNRLVG